ncbi:MAG TPA: leucyl/phenylalanyl-tRNA--protein transferase [Flavobacterium sp.]|jgi:leucyl/phenylalanyl-tRNA--protein transferase
MHRLTDDLYFPPAEKAGKNGIVAYGGDLSPQRLMLAYQNGIFPWFNDDEPILWWSPPQRMVLFFSELQISKSMRKVLKSGIFTVTFNQNFTDVISNCAAIPRNGETGTWITNDMQQAYIELHKLGVAKSVEVWREGELVGGLYGIDLGNIFCGESMFSKESNASKVAFIALAEHLQANNYKLLDCQIYNDHLASLGAREIPRGEFLNIIKST